jgi:putative DNA methylase
VTKSTFDWRGVRLQSRREGTFKDGPYRLHKWWARRPPTLVREMLRHARSRLPPRPLSTLPLDGLRVLDPFVGGGSVAVEAARLGAEVHAFDVRPLAIRMLGVALGPPIRVEDWKLIERTLNSVQKATAAFYPGTRRWRPLHYFWVDRVRCEDCRRAFDAHPTALLASHPRLGEAVGICLSCSKLQRIAPRRRTFLCPCGFRNRLSAGNSRNGRYYCPHCRHVERIRDHVKRLGKGTPRRLVVKEQVDKAGNRRFRLVTRRDVAAFAKAAGALARLRTDLPIGNDRVPIEIGDSRPQAYGVAKFGELFNDRQLLLHGLLFRAIAALPSRARGVASLVASEALATNCTMNAYATAYGRASAAFSIHGYMYVTRPVELNPWIAGSGRGTLWNCLRKARFALAESTNGHQRHELYVGSLDTIARRTPKVDIVCTDPPYYDNVEYERLANFYETWLKRIPLPQAIHRPGGTPLPMRGKAFSVGLGTVLRRAADALRANGLVIFTYAHSSQEGWDALERALTIARLRVLAVYPAEAEGRNGFHRYKGSLKWNAVIVCTRADSVRLSTAEIRAAVETARMSKADKSNLRRAVRAAVRVNRKPSLRGRKPHGSNRSSTRSSSA